MDIGDHEDRLTVREPKVPGAKFEAVCHLCSWSFHKWTKEEALSSLRQHVIEEHLLESRRFTIGTGPSTT
jgi:hypothetical protein